MKPSAIIINTARGAVIDEAALVAALEEGRIASAGLDVYEEEPEVHQGLIGNPRVVLLPHMGTWSVEVSPRFSFLGLVDWGLIFLSVWGGVEGVGEGTWGKGENSGSGIGEEGEKGEDRGKGDEVVKCTANVLQTQTAMELFNVANIRSMLETGKLKSRIPEQKDMPYD